jgi:hypothetical protein
MLSRMKRFRCRESQIRLPLKTSTASGAKAKYQVAATFAIICPPYQASRQLRPVAAAETVGMPPATPRTISTIAVHRAQLRIWSNPHATMPHPAPTRNALCGPANSRPYMKGALIAGKIVPGATNSITPTAHKYPATPKNPLAMIVKPAGRSISNESNQAPFGFSYLQTPRALPLGYWCGLVSCTRLSS